MKMRLQTSWLTARRIRVHGFLFVVCMWSVYAMDMATTGLRDRSGLIKGTDFLQFYAIGNLALRGHSELLYNVGALSAFIQKIIPQAGAMVYAPLYGPQVLLLFLPFAQLPYEQALLIWLLLNVAIYACCVYFVWTACPHLRAYSWTVLILAAGFPGFFHLIAWGQTSGLALACFTAAFLALRSHRKFLAGIAIGSLILKPQLGLAAALVFLLAREGTIVLGAVLSAAAQLAVAWACYGTEVMRSYFRALLHAREILPLLEPRPYQMHSLWNFWSLLIPWREAAFVLYVGTSVAALVWTLRCWRSNSPLGIRYSSLLIATALVSPHLMVYDLVILAPAFLWFADWAVENRGGRFASTVPWLLYACYFLFLLGPLARYTHLQLSVLAMAALLWMTNAATLSFHDHTIATEYQTG